jgi:hypothetical protein
MRAMLISALAATAAALALSAAASSAPTRSACTPGQDCGLADLQLTGTVNEAQSQVGDSLVWQLTANDYNTYPILNVYVDVTLPAGTQYVSAVTDRGAGCTATSATTLHCSLDWLSKDVQFGHVTITTKVNGTGAHTLTATTGYSSPSGPVADPIPANNTVSLTSTTTIPTVYPVIATGVASPAVTAGKTVTITFNVTRSDNQQPMTDGTMTVTSTLGTAAIVNTPVFANGAAQVKVTIPKKKVKGKKLFVSVTITSTTNGVATKSAKFTVH